MAPNFDKVAREQLRRFGPIALGVLILATLFVWVYKPRLASLKATRKGLADTIKELDFSYRAVSDIAEVVEENDETESELQAAIEKYPTKGEIVAVLKKITDAAADLDLDIKRVEPGEEVVDGFLVRKPMRLAMVCDYFAFAQYLLRIGQVARLVSCERIVMSAPDDAYPRIEVELSLLLYFLNE